MDRRTFLAATASATLVTVAGCGGSGSDSDPETAVDTTVDTTVETTAEADQPSEPAAEIQIAGNSFDPIRKSVDPGSEVVWTNTASIAHTVDSQTFHDVAESWSVDTDTLDPGESTTYTFEESGVYEYSCSIHGGSNMCGVVLVGDASLDERLPCEASVGSGGGGNGSAGNGSTTGTDTS